MEDRGFVAMLSEIGSFRKILTYYEASVLERIIWGFIGMQAAFKIKDRLSEMGNIWREEKETQDSLGHIPKLICQAEEKVAKEAKQVI